MSVAVYSRGGRRVFRYGREQFVPTIDGLVRLAGVG
jgi:hypothetical protein